MIKKSVLSSSLVIADGVGRESVTLSKLIRYNQRILLLYYRYLYALIRLLG